MKLRDPVLWAWLVIDLVAAGSLGWILSARFRQVEALRACPAPPVRIVSKAASQVLMERGSGARGRGSVKEDLRIPGRRL